MCFFNLFLKPAGAVVTCNSKKGYVKAACGCSGSKYRSLAVAFWNIPCGVLEDGPDSASGHETTHRTGRAVSNETERCPAYID